MKLLLILIIWFVLSIPAGIVLGRFCAVGNGLLADTSSRQEKESDTLSESQKLLGHPAKEAA